MKRSPVNKVNRDRRRKDHKTQYGELADFIRSKPCIVPGCPHAKNQVDVAHVQSRRRFGAWGEHGKGNLVPLCRHHHLEQHAIGIETFQARHNIDLLAVAHQLASAYLSSHGVPINHEYDSLPTSKQTLVYGDAAIITMSPKAVDKLVSGDPDFDFILAANVPFRFSAVPILILSAGTKMHVEAIVTTSRRVMGPPAMLLPTVAGRCGHPRSAASMILGKRGEVEALRIDRAYRLESPITREELPHVLLEGTIFGELKRAAAIPLRTLRLNTTTRYLVQENHGITLHDDNLIEIPRQPQLIDSDGIPL